MPIQKVMKKKAVKPSNKCMPKKKPSEKLNGIPTYVFKEKSKIYKGLVEAK